MIEFWIIELNVPDWLGTHLEIRQTSQTRKHSRKVVIFNLLLQSWLSTWTWTSSLVMIFLTSNFKHYWDYIPGILVALAVILTVIIVMAVYRRRRPAFGDKDIDCGVCVFHKYSKRTSSMEMESVVSVSDSEHLIFKKEKRIHNSYP